MGAVRQKLLGGGGPLGAGEAEAHKPVFNEFPSGAEREAACIPVSVVGRIHDGSGNDLFSLNGLSFKADTGFEGEGFEVILFDGVKAP